MARRSIEKAEERLQARIDEQEEAHAALVADAEAISRRIWGLREALEIIRTAAPEEKDSQEQA